jgi:type I restriction enzyme S subunit
MNARNGSTAGLRRFKPYPQYKNSGVEWLSAIPAHWKITKMWDVADAISGGTPTKEVTEYWEGTIPWISAKDMKRRQIDSSEDSISEAALRETALKMVPPGSVLIVVRGMILAHTFPVGISKVPLTINQDLKALRLRDELDCEFFAYWLEGVGSPLLDVVVEEAAHGTKAIRMDRWRVMPVEVPPKAEQRAIANFLDREMAKIDALMAKKERLIELLQEKRAALITQAVTKGLDPTVPMRDSGVEWLSTIPVHWKITKMWDVTEAISGGTPTREVARYWQGSIPWVSAKDMKRRVIDASEDSISEVAVKESRLKIILPGSVLIVVRGMILAHTFPVGISQVPLTINQDLKALSLHQQLDCEFFAYWLEGVGPQLLDVVVEEAAHGTKAIRMDRWRVMPVQLPPKEEQRTIVSFLDSSTVKIDALNLKVRDAIDRLKELRTALISAAVTGKIDVREEIA